jgi:hypothetical protein
VQRRDWLARFLRCYKATIDLLDRIQAEAGYPHKDVASVDLADYKACPVWFDGQLEIGYNNEPESVAHELGHGLHEKIRDVGKSDFLGEEFAEAIRFYVETGMMTGSSWLKGFHKDGNPFAKRYRVNEFIGALKSGDLFKTVGWN